MSEPLENREPEYEALVEDLKKLRNGHGATASRLDGFPRILRALGADNGEAARILLDAKVKSLGRDPKARALYNAFGFGMSHAGTAKSRRDALAAHGPPGFAQLLNYENEMIEALAKRLLNQTPTAKHNVVTVEIGHRAIRGVWTNPYKAGYEAIVFQNHYAPSAPPVFIWKTDYNHSPKDRLTVRMLFAGERPASLWIDHNLTLLSALSGATRRPIPLDNAMREWPDGDDADEGGWMQIEFDGYVADTWIVFVWEWKN